MGWTSTHAQYYKKGTVDRKRECDAYWEEGLNRGHFKILKSSMVGSTYYAAVQVLKQYEGEINGKASYKDVENGEVFGIIFLTSVNMKDYYNFSYKPMDETMGPYRYDCPISILKLLSETDSEYALKWRQKCWDNHNRKKNPNGIHKLPEGSIIKVIMPFDTKHCREGKEVFLFKRKWGKRNRWFMENTNVYFTKGLMKCVTENGFEIIQRGEQ